MRAASALEEPFTAPDLEMDIEQYLEQAATAAASPGNFRASQVVPR